MTVIMMAIPPSRSGALAFLRCVLHVIDTSVAIGILVVFGGVRKTIIPG
jgi:hypothetical protein